MAKKKKRTKHGTAEEGATHETDPEPLKTEESGDKDSEANDDVQEESPPPPSKRARPTEEEEEDADADDDDDDDDNENNNQDNKDDYKDNNAMVAFDPLPIVATTDTQVGPKALSKTQPIIILLDQATLETVKRNNVFELLNCDDHRELAKRKLRKDPNHYRPDILHQELLALQDSPLNKAGLLKIYIATQKKVLIDIHPATRIPRTYKRFAGLMVQLLHKMKIKAGQDHTTLLKVIKNPFSQYLPPGTRCYGMSCQGTLYSPIKLAPALLPADYSNPKAPPTCFVVGAMSTGHVQLEDHPYMEKMISVSEYPLSGAAALSRIVTGIEHYWGIV